MPGRKGNKSSKQPLLSPEKYIRTKARQLPIYQCFITESWKETGAANIFISRRQPSGNIVVGGYYIDLFCCGLKDSLYVFNISEYEFRDMTKDTDPEVPMIECSYVLAHNIIYGGIAYAEELGLKPHKDWAVSQYILDDDTDDVEFMDIQFGQKNGRPMLIVTPVTSMTHVIRTLDKTIGRDAYDLVEGDDWLDEEDDEDYEENDEDYDGIEEDDEDEEDEALSEEEAAQFMDLFFGEIVENFWNLYDSPGKRADKLDTIDHIRTTDYQLTDDPLQGDLYNITQEEIKLLQDMLNIVIDDPEAAIERLEPLVKQYPRNPIMHNYLMKAYFEADRDEQATQLILEGYRKFPGYLLARCNYAHYLISEERFKEVPAIFEGVFDLKLLYPERESFHVSEYVNFYDVIARYYIMNGNIRNADHLIAQLSNVVQENMDTQFHSLQKLLWHKKLSLMFGDSPLLDGPAMAEWKPVYQHRVVEKLHEKGVEIDESVLKEILALPPDEWIADLKQGVFEAFIKIFSDMKILDGDEVPEFICHAFFLIGESGRPEELDYLLAILGQNYEILDSLFGDILTEKAWMPVYRLGMDRLETLYEFCLSDIEAENKSLVTQALVQIALQEPDKRVEVTEIFRRLAMHYINLEECTEDDEDFLNYMAGDIADLKDPSFIPVLKPLEDRDILNKEIYNSFDELVDEILDQKVKSPTWPVQDIFEIYRDVRKWNN